MIEARFEFVSKISSQCIPYLISVPFIDVEYHYFVETAFDSENKCSFCTMSLN